MPNMFKGERHLFGHNFTGIGTRTDLRLNQKTGEPYDWSTPVNVIDSIALNHDRAYDMYGDTKKGQHVADKIMVKELDSLDPNTLSTNEKMQRFLVRNAINLKQKLGFGLEPVDEQTAHELHHRIIRNFPRRKVIVYYIDQIWSADLVEMPTDKDHHYILTVIDVLSKYAFAVPLKNKKSETIIDAFKNIFKTSDRKPVKLWTDAGSEFTNKQFKHFCQTENIEPYQTFNEGKAVIIERFNRTVKEKMWFNFTLTGSKHWVDLLPKIINDYNHSYHHTIKATPIFASRKENESLIRNNLLGNYNTYSLDQKPRYAVGDLVRIYKWKDTFDKGYETNFTREIFKISKVIFTIPVTYKLVDLKGEEIIGSFYTQELVKART